VLTYRKGHYLKRLNSVFKSEELNFLQRPFEVLIAGCGTGRQAVSAAFDYGTNARVTAFDIALPSLGYASTMADRMGARNVRFLHADIQQIETVEPSLLGRFHVIECIGVLHHMTRPLDGWFALSKCLAPGGLMLIGLYSASARRNLAILKADPAYPGPGCDADALRRYRQHLLTLPKGAPGSEFRRGMDFYSSSGFRDFFLHVSERCFTIPEIKQFLDLHSLRFRGFFDLPFQLLQDTKPTAEWPGTLDQWATCEAERPELFPSMYQFWCTAA
jgi:SAM-dependent methyltransferase